MTTAAVVLVKMSPLSGQPQFRDILTNTAVPWHPSHHDNHRLYMPRDNSWLSCRWTAS